MNIDSSVEERSLLLAQDTPCFGSVPQNTRRGSFIGKSFRLCWVLSFGGGFFGVTSRLLLGGVVFAGWWLYQLTNDSALGFLFDAVGKISSWSSSTGLE